MAQLSLNLFYSSWPFQCRWAVCLFIRSLHWGSSTLVSRQVQSSLAA